MRRIGASVIERVTQACVCASMLLAPVAATQAATEEELRQVASLPPLPADWEPDAPGQGAVLRKIRES